MPIEVLCRDAVTGVEGPLVFLDRVVQAGVGEALEIEGADGARRLGRIVAIDEEKIVVELLESTAGLGITDAVVRFRGEPVMMALGPGLLGRVFDGVGRPRDGGTPVPALVRRRVDTGTINPATRGLPQDFIETGVSSIDILNSLVRGQKLPIFSAGGLPHDRLAAAIAQNARLRGDRDEGFAVVFAGIGVSHDAAESFRAAMEQSGALEHTAMFLNLASEPSAQRLLTPRFALTAAEYLAFDEGRHVLVVLTDMTNYCEALREVSASRGEIPSRKGYPGYMYSDLATIFERAGWIRGRPGTLTQLPILTMPSDDISHPIPDLTGYITEGQIVLDRKLEHQGVYPPVNVLPSLSRLIDQGIGAGFTHEDHPALAQQLFATYARAARVRVLSSVVGREGLTPTDRLYLDFGDRFENDFVNQDAMRSFEESFDLGWDMLAMLPAVELSRLSDAQIARHVTPRTDEGGDG
ncbi:V-type ATP synthase subunit B [Mesobacterium sp. TK19101]|uniref:V-type ATP synthase beta chain n=1 Tax=Mesobacterium hydrothermale TaxID=3111907 RepID=A0ABU6HK05_9RHOB|nr:V-type ATP synthase subunit B [Mesobacterium sp. TK19101]MEC3862787.1 V-type ATP synthase subunit B [Mesobacterium sp. TK19101]